VREAFRRLEEADLRQEPAAKMAWYEAQYEHELATYVRVCSQKSATVYLTKPSRTNTSSAHVDGLSDEACQ
jgi:hypothetical protein